MSLLSEGVAVTVNSRALADGVLTDEHRNTLTSLITTAAGLETKVVNVSAREFYDVVGEFDVFDGDTTQFSPGVPLWLVGAILGTILVIGGLGFMITRKRKFVKEAEEAAAAEEERKAVEAIQVDREDTTSPKYQIEKFIDAKPEAVAQLLRSWINED